MRDAIDERRRGDDGAGPALARGVEGDGRVEVGRKRRGRGAAKAVVIVDVRVAGVRCRWAGRVAIVSAVGGERRECKVRTELN